MSLTLPSATEAVVRIAAGSLTAEALVAQCLKQISEREEVVGAWEHLDPAHALAQARERDGQPPQGPLHGVPVGVKDVIDTADMPTAYGSSIYRGHAPARDAACVAFIRAAGGIILGKTVTAEFAYFTPGKTANPRNVEHTPGGSSSGSAAAVADSMAPLALGTQTAGSVIRPASFCGVVGYKPSFGLISRAGVWPFAESLDTVGVFASSVADAALLASVAADRAEVRERPPPEGPPSVGIHRTHEWERAAPESQAAVTEAADSLERAGARVADVAVPDSFAGLVEAQKTVMAFEAARAFAHERRTREDELSPRLRELLEEGDRASSAEYEGALALAGRCRRRLGELLERHDVLLTPSAIGEAPHGLSATGDPLFNRAWTLLGPPCLHIPTSTGPRGLPIGVQVVGPFGQDARTLAIAEWVERQLG